MKHEEKKKRALEIADELQQLGYSDVAAALREAVNSGKSTSNESSESNEGGEQQGSGGDGEGGNGGGNNPGQKPPFKKKS